MKIRVFGSKDCYNCTVVMNKIHQSGFDYYFIDALSFYSDALCDKYNVERLPHVQILDEEDNVVWEQIEDISIEEIKKVMKNAK